MKEEKIESSVQARVSMFLDRSQKTWTVKEKNS